MMNFKLTKHDLDYLNNHKSSFDYIMKLDNISMDKLVDYLSKLSQKHKELAFLILEKRIFFQKITIHFNLSSISETHKSIKENKYKLIKALTKTSQK